MIVCICHRVSHHDIARAVRGGCASFDELQLALSVATSCGACHDCARDTFEQQRCNAAGTCCHASAAGAASSASQTASA